MMVAPCASVSCIMIRTRVSHDLAHVSLRKPTKMSRTRIALDAETRQTHYVFGSAETQSGGVTMGSMKIGYARTSTVEQLAGLAAQERELRAAGAEKVFSERVSSVAKREQLAS